MQSPEFTILRFLTVAALPWAIAAWGTRKSLWSQTPWLNWTIRIQTALVVIVAVAQVFGTAGLFNTAALFFTPLTYVLITLAYADHVKVKQAISSANADKARTQIVSLSCIVMVTMVLVKLGVPSLVGSPKVVSDGPIYHLYFAARWWLDHTIYWIPIPFGENAAPYFPANGDLWFMTLTGWCGNLTLAKLGQVPFWFLGGFWIYQLCRVLGSRNASALLASSIWMTITPLALFTFEANVDTIFSAWFIVSILFYIVFDRQNQVQEATDEKSSTTSPSRRNILLTHCLLAAGLAWGTKAPGIVFIPPWIVFVTIRETIWHGSQKSHRKILNLLKMWGIATIPVMFWWIRNFVATGNPLYPLPVSIFGITVMDGWYGPEVMSQSPYYLPREDGHAFLDQLFAVADVRLFPVYVISMLYVFVIFFRSRTWENKWLLSLCILGLGTVAIYWLVIPYRTQQRFFLHGMAMFAPAIATLADRSQKLCAGITALLILHVTTPQGWPFTVMGKEPPWDLSPIIPNAVPGLVPFPEFLFRTISGEVPLIGLCICIGGIAMFFMVRSRKWAIIGSIVVFTGLAMACYGEYNMRQKIGRGIRFPIFPDYERAWNALDSVTRKSPMTVAYSGTNLVLYLMGPELENRAIYVNIDSHSDWMPHDYHLAQPRQNRSWPDPRPTWERLDPDYESWLANLERAGVDLVVVARANPNEGKLNPYDSRGFPIERTWMIQHPERFQAVYGVREDDPEMQIFSLDSSQREIK